MKLIYSNNISYISKNYHGDSGNSVPEEEITDIGSQLLRVNEKHAFTTNVHKSGRSS